MKPRENGGEETVSVEVDAEAVEAAAEVEEAMADPADAPAVEEPAEEDPLTRAEREREEYLELAQRAQADFDNYRKRVAKDLATAGARAKGTLVRELLPVVDNLERALSAAEEPADGLLEGVKLVHGGLVAALERSGVEGYAPDGEPFDPALHEAISTRADEGVDSGVIVEVVEKGYRLDQTVLRPARVVVAA